MKFSFLFWGYTVSPILTELSHKLFRPFNMTSVKPEDRLSGKSNERREQSENENEANSTLETRQVEPVATSVSMPFDVRLVPEYDGTTDVVEWFTRATLLCEMRGVDLMSVVPLRLAGGAFAVWSQLPAQDRGSLLSVRSALFAAFALDQFAAYDAFSARKLQPGESPDVFLSELRRLAALFGGASDRILICAFVAGLPESVRQTIRAGTRADSLDLTSTLARVRAVMNDDRGITMAAATAVRGEREARRPPWRGGRRIRRCWTCGSQDHISPQCPVRSSENGNGNVASAPASSPEQ